MRPRGAPPPTLAAVLNHDISHLRPSLPLPIVPQLYVLSQQTSQKAALNHTALSYSRVYGSADTLKLLPLGPS